MPFGRREVILSSTMCPWKRRNVVRTRANKTIHIKHMIGLVAQEIFERNEFQAGTHDQHEQSEGVLC